MSSYVESFRSLSGSTLRQHRPEAVLNISPIIIMKTGSRGNLLIIVSSAAVTGIKETLAACQPEGASAGENC